jgi:hypothetical protein
MLAGGTAVPGGRIGLSEQIAADLLPEAAEPGEVGP